METDNEKENKSNKIIKKKQKVLCKDLCKNVDDKEQCIFDNIEKLQLEGYC